MSGYWYKKSDGSMIQPYMDDLEESESYRSRHHEYWEPDEGEMIEPSHFDDISVRYNRAVEEAEKQDNPVLEGLKRGNFFVGVGIDLYGNVFPGPKERRRNHWGSMPPCTAERVSYRTHDRCIGLPEAQTEKEWQTRRGAHERTQHDIKTKTYLKHWYDVMIEEVPDMREILTDPHEYFTEPAITVSSLTQSEDEALESHYADSKEENVETDAEQSAF